MARSSEDEGASASASPEASNRRASRSTTLDQSNKHNGGPVVRIVSRQHVSRVGAQFRCEVEGGKYKFFNQDTLQQHYPQLLASFLDDLNPSSSDSDDELVVTQLRPTAVRSAKAPAPASKLNQPRSANSFYVKRSTNPSSSTRSSKPAPAATRSAQTGKTIRVVVLDDDSDPATASSADDIQIHQQPRHSDDSLSGSAVTQHTTTDDDQSDLDSAAPPARPTREATLRRKRATESDSDNSPPKRNARRSARVSNATQAVDSDSDMEVQEPPRRQTRLSRGRPAPSSGDDIDMLTTRPTRGKAQGKGKGAAKGKAKAKATGKVKAKGRTRIIQLDSSEDESDGGGEDDESQSEAGESDELEIDWTGQIRPQHDHSEECAKCERGPAPVLIRKFEAYKKSKGKRRKRDVIMKDTDDEREDLYKLGGWYECETCIESYHFNCLAEDIKKEIIKGFRAQYDLANPLPLDSEGNPIPRNRFVADPRPKLELDVDARYTVPACTSCSKPNGRRCFVCGVKGRLGPDQAEKASTGDEVDGDGDVEVAEVDDAKEDEVEPGLMFRCNTCRRGVHYECCAVETDDETLEERAASYKQAGQCHDCWRWQTPLDGILAWAAEDAAEDGKSSQPDWFPSLLDPTSPAEYLVKWKDLSFRKLDWVPHAFLAAKFPQKLKNFLLYGPRINLDPPPEGNELEDDEELIFAAEDTTPGQPDKRMLTGSPPQADPDAESRVPEAWKTVDRILNVGFKAKRSSKDPPKYYIEIPSRILDADPSETIGDVVEVDIKWADLPYNQWTREAPPEEGDQGYDSFVRAYGRWIVANRDSMRVPNNLSKKQMALLDQPRSETYFATKLELKAQPDFLSGGTLMDFQLAGVNRMLFSWWMKKGMILADEMGLGKTVQVISFLGTLEKKEGARPFLVAVPNSTLPNWVREFEKWAPSIRVVPYSGEKDDRKVIEEFEMFTRRGELKTHVVVVTYEALEKNAAVFRRVSRWDTLVVDEGQRLKGGRSGLLFQAVASLNIGHKVILSGTPIQNNVLELFNLLHFLNPEEVPNPEELAIEYAELDAEKVDTIRGMLQPRMLRRTKELVLDLPQLTEIVIPCTMTPVQREMYQSILRRNVSAIENLAASSAGVRNEKAPTKKGTANLNNILMELRKCLGHPYLNHPEMYPVGLPEDVAHDRLTTASTKLVLLSLLLPKLKARGHRVLLFSQFRMTLDLIEDFLNGERIKFLRLDGETSTLNRQRGIDAFNKPNSEYSIYLLSTRAGGVGINLTSADTVIIYDQDFNPQQDIQAIARAHRIGQTKPVRVFKLMVKGTCEEKILQACNKKLGLDHLIIKRMDEKDPTEAVESILQYGAKAIFDDEETAKQAIRYTEKDIDDLIDRSSKPVDKSTESAGATFAQAQIWRREEADIAAVGVDDLAQEGDVNQHDFWAKILADQQEKDRQAKAAALAMVGRGKRKRNEAVDYTDRAKPKPKAPATGAAAPSSDGGVHIDSDSGDEFAPEGLELSADEASQPSEAASDDMVVDAAAIGKGKGQPQAKLARAADDASVSQAKAKARQDHKTEKKLAKKRLKALQALVAPAKLLGLTQLLQGLEKAKELGREEQVTFLRESVVFVQTELGKCEVAGEGPVEASAESSNTNGGAPQPAPTAAPTASTSTNGQGGSKAVAPVAPLSASLARFGIPGVTTPRMLAERKASLAPSATPPVLGDGQGQTPPAQASALSPTAGSSGLEAASASVPKGASASPPGAGNGAGRSNGAPVRANGRAGVSATPVRGAASPGGSAARARATPSSVTASGGKMVEVLTLDDSDSE